MSDADVIRWRRRRTARWMSLSLAARGAVEGVVAALDAHGELQLPKSGLEALAAVLGRPWAEVEPAIREAFESGKLVFDEARLVIVDPSHEPRPASDREETDALRLQVAKARAELAEVQHTTKALSQSPGAVRARRARAAKRARDLAAAHDDRQLDLYASVTRDVTRDDRNARVTPAAEPPAESGVFTLSSEAHASVTRNVTRNAASLSYFKSSSDQREARVTLGVTSRMPDGWLEHARAKRPDLGDEAIERSWTAFRALKARTYASWAVVQTVWEVWLARERKPKVDEPAAKPPSLRARGDSAPYLRPAKLARPDEEPEAPPPREFRRRIEPPSPLVLDAMARLTAAVGASP